MPAQFEVIDADGHITEEDGQLKKYMLEKFLKRVAPLTPRRSWDRSLDFSHSDTEFPEKIDHLSRREDLNDDAKKWRLAESAKKLNNLR